MPACRNVRRGMPRPASLATWLARAWSPASILNPTVALISGDAGGGAGAGGGGLVVWLALTNALMAKRLERSFMCGLSVCPMRRLGWTSMESQVTQDYGLQTKD